MTTLPEEAVTSADIIRVITDLRLAILQDDDEGLAEHAEPMVKAKELIAKLSASPFLSVQGAVNIDAIVQPLEDIHAPGGLCRWTDVATAIGEVRRSLSALEPSAARELALEEGDLNARLKAKGMYSIDEMMGGLPLDKWRVHSGMTDLKFFGEWLERKAREYLIMKAAYDVGRKDEGDDLYEWVLAHYGAFHDVLVNFRAALSSPDHADAGKVEEVKLPTERVCIPDPHNTDARIVGFRIREGDDAWGETGLSEPIFWLNKLLTADAGKVEGDGWLPIESAPKNKAIQIYIPNADYYGNDGIYAGILVDLGTGQRWATFGWAVARDLPPHMHPTHWRPLPSAPSQEAAGS